MLLRSTVVVLFIVHFWHRFIWIKWSSNLHDELPNNTVSTDSYSPLSVSTCNWIMDWYSFYNLTPLHVVKHCYMKSCFKILEKREIYILHPISSPVSKFSCHANLWINSQTQWLQRKGNLGFTITGNNLFTLQWITCSVSLFPHRHRFLSCN